MAKRQKPTMEDRVAEYVDSPSIRMRVKHKKLVSARVRGVYGDYRTRTDRSLKKPNGECTCPSELWPCKHILALRKTWDVNPESFLDLEQILSSLATQPAADLVNMIKEIVLQYPEGLSILGVSGFEDDQDDWYEY